MNYIQELSRTAIVNDLSNYYDIDFSNYTDNDLNTFFTNHVNEHKQEIKMIDFYNLPDDNILIESLDGFVRVGERIKKENLECYTLTLVDGRKLSGAFNHLVETERGWVALSELSKDDYVLTIDGFFKVKNVRQIKTQDVYDLECLHVNHRYLSNGISNHNTGKSYFAVMLMDWFRKNFNPNTNFDVLTNSKILQEQYTKDFDFMNSLWGRASYECGQYQCDCATGSEWAKIQNTKCNDCPYATAKYRFENGDIALTNFHLFVTYMALMPTGWKRKSQVLIIDEADSFESVFCDFVTAKISKMLLKRNGLTDEEVDRAMSVFGTYPEDLTIKQFVEIIENEFLPIIASVMNRLSRESEDGNMQALTYMNSLNNNFLKWEILKSEFEKMPDNWILEVDKVKKETGTGKKKKIETYIEFTAQPVWAYPYLYDKIWKRYDYVIFMSGTILDKNMFCKMNGLDNAFADYISVDSPFPVENRPIFYFKNVGKYTYKTKEIVWPKQKLLLEKLIKKHKGQKGIIHTTNYELQGNVRQLNDDRLLTHDSTNRSDVLQLHYNSPEPTILVSPSMMVGVDLHSDFSRFQVILKMPYPSLASKKIKKRMETEPDYYSLTTVRDLIQAYGRSIRSYDDYANTYILDSCFGDILNWSGRRWIPNWIKSAIQIIE
jgi:ATP-dependent DNA helicase DinG